MTRTTVIGPEGSAKRVGFGPISFLLALLVGFVVAIPLAILAVVAFTVLAAGVFVRRQVTLLAKGVSGVLRPGRDGEGRENVTVRR